MGTIKSGTLEKQGGFMWKGWKRKHCVLYRDGEFAIYENATDANAEFRINVPTDMKQLKNGFDCGPIDIPKNRRYDSIFREIHKRMHTLSMCIKTTLFIRPTYSIRFHT